MKAKFAGFYPLTKVELDRLWKEGCFVFDTNILLNLYRYGETSRNEWLAVIADIQDRLWTPHQVALEYQRNRRSTISRLHEQFTALIQIAGFAKHGNARAGRDQRETPAGVAGTANRNLGRTSHGTGDEAESADH